MYGHPFSIRQSLIDLGRPRPAVWVDPRVHKSRIQGELKEAGISALELIRSECRYLPEIIHSNEHIGGAIMGKHEAGKVLLVATDRRIILLDKKPLYTTEDEINFDAVNGIELGHAGLGSTVTLHTRIKEYKLRTFNSRAAARFARYIERRCLEHGKDFQP